MFKKFIQGLDKDTFSAASRASVAGLHIVSGIIVGTGIGFLLDRWLDTGPWATSIFFLFGVVAGFRNMWLDAKRIIKSQNESTKAPEETDKKP